MIQFDDHIFQMGWNHQLIFYNASFRGGDIIDRKPIHHHGRKLKHTQAIGINLGVSNFSDNSKFVTNACW